MQFKTFLLFVLRIKGFVLVSFFAGLTAYSQTNFQVGSGTDLTSGYPIMVSSTNGYDYSINAAIYTAAELSASGVPAGTISAIGWNYLAGPVVSGQMTIYLKLTNNTEFTGNPTFAAAISGATQVYNAVATTNVVSGWVTVTLATPFYWNGVSNLAVITQFQKQNVISGIGNLAWNGTNLGTGITRNATTANSSSFPTVFYTLYEERVNTRFSFITVGVENWNSKSQWTIHNTPLSGIITITSNQRFDHADIRLINLLGQEVYAVSVSDRISVDIDISVYQRGIYIAEITEGRNILRQKIVLQ